MPGECGPCYAGAPLQEPAAADDAARGFVCAGAGVGVGGSGGIGGVEDGGLAGSDGALGLVEADFDGPIGVGEECGGGRVVAVADLDGDVEGRVERFDANPIHVGDAGGGGAEVGVVADDELILQRVERDDVHGAAGGDAEAAALADGEAMEAVVLAEDGAIGSDDFADRVIATICGGVRFVLLAAIGFDEGGVVAARDEANFLAFGLFGDGDAQTAGDGANFVFGKLAEGE